MNSTGLGTPERLLPSGISPSPFPAKTDCARVLLRKVDMITICPACKTSLCFMTRGTVDGVKIRCSSCGSLFQLVRKSGNGSTGIASPKPGLRRLQVVIANEQKSFCSLVAGVLGERFDFVYCHDGRIALEIINRLKPDVALIDVALPGMFGFEVCEAVRKNAGLTSVKLILVATVHDNRRYVRSPESLYGADAVIDPQRVHSSLRELVDELAGPAAEPEPAGVAEPDGPGDDDAAATVSFATTLSSGMEQPPATTDQLSPEHQKAQRLARLIVSDIALYNLSLVDQGVRNGNLLELLADDVREARALYQRRVPEQIRSSSSYLDDAFSDLIARKKKQLEP